MTKDEHLAHLLRLTAHPFSVNWQRYAEARALELASTAGLEDLPVLFAAAMKQSQTSVD